jgi:hypothetical protein
MQRNVPIRTTRVPRGLDVPVGQCSVRRTQHINRDTQIEPLIQMTFPDYRGRMLQITATDCPVNVDSYWSGGSRSFYAFVDLYTMKAMPVPPTDPMNQRTKPQLLVPPNTILVEHRIFAGKDMGLTFYVHPDTAFTPQTAIGPGLTREEKIVLVATRSLKPSYAGISDYRFHQARQVTGINRQQWEQTKQQLIQKKLLNRAGAITNQGRNALEAAGGFLQLYDLE